VTPLRRADFMGYVWRELFQGLVLDHTEFWRSKLEAAVSSSDTYDELLTFSRAGASMASMDGE
jgi:hypothetical protein